MRLLMLYGVNCTKEIWKKLEPYLTNFEVDYVSYPHEVTSKAISVDMLSKWGYDQYKDFNYDAVIGHSMGGLIALQLAAKYHMNFSKIIYLDTNLKPADVFYRNLMTPEHMELYGEQVGKMFQDERAYYSNELLCSIQEDFDYTDLLQEIPQKVYGIYGDRNRPEYDKKIQDLNLSSATLEKLEISFVNNACHMMMIENPLGTYEKISEILSEEFKE